jgi:hypothetical protein
MRATTSAREAFAAAIAFETARVAVDLRLGSGDERGQTIDAAVVGHRRLRLGLRLILRLRTMLAMAGMFSGLMIVFAMGVMVARLVRLPFTLLVALMVVAWGEWLRLYRDKARLLTEMRKTIPFVVAILRSRFVFGTRLRLVLSELLLRCGDQAEIMFGMLIVVFGGDRVAGGTRVTRQLDVFFRDVRCGTADFDVGSVGLEHPCHRVLTASVVIIIIVVVTVTHPLVVLTVSHVLPLFQP